jgi:hypothetical protein
VTKRRGVSIRFDVRGGGWRIYWSCTDELADERLHQKLIDAGAAARALLHLPDDLADELVRCSAVPA